MQKIQAKMETGNNVPVRHDSGFVPEHCVLLGMGGRREGGAAPTRLQDGTWALGWSGDGREGRAGKSPGHQHSPHTQPSTGIHTWETNRILKVSELRANPSPKERKLREVRK